MKSEISREKYLIFDFDGTIADTMLMVLEIFNEFAPSYGLKPLDYKDLEEMRKMHVMKMILFKARIPFWKIPQASLLIKSELTKRIAQIPIFPGIKEVMLDLKHSGYQLLMLTSNSEENVHKFLQVNDLEIFEHIHAGVGLLSKHKALKSFLNKLEIDKSDAIYIGDESRDIKASHKAGLKIVSVTWGFNSRSYLETYKPDYIVDHVDDLVKIKEWL